MPKKTTIRTTTGKTKEVELTRDLAIRSFCTECLGYEDHPRICTAPLCPLFPFRGKSLLAFHPGDDDE